MRHAHAEVLRYESGTAAEDLPRLALDLFAYPNPANPKTTLEVRLPHGGPVTLDAYDARGRRLRRLVR